MINGRYSIEKRFSLKKVVQLERCETVCVDQIDENKFYGVIDYSQRVGKGFIMVINDSYRIIYSDKLNKNHEALFKSQHSLQEFISNLIIGDRYEVFEFNTSHDLMLWASNIST
jgi:hypothetical protein